MIDGEADGLVDQALENIQGKMMNAKTLLLTVGMLTTSGTLAYAQAMIAPIYNWNYQNHASTVVEGFLNGQAQVIQSVGQAEYLNSVAAVNYQEANRQWIENRQAYVNAYYQNKEIIREHRQRYSRKPPTKEQWARITAKSLPPRLNAEQLDTASGQLIWPHVLRSAEYSAFRNRIDELIATRTPDNSGDGSPFQQQVALLVDGMSRLLKSNISFLSATQYADAKAFLRSLDYEVKQQFNQPDSISLVSVNTAGNY